MSPSPNGAHQQNWAVDSSTHVTLEHVYAISQPEADESGAIFAESDWGDPTYINIDSSYAEGDSGSLDMSEGWIASYGSSRTAR